MHFYILAPQVVCRGMLKIYLLLVCTLHPEIFSLGEVIGAVFLLGKSERESLPCAMNSLDIFFSFLSWKGESFPSAMVWLDT
jgi:hypothetical protein